MLLGGDRRALAEQVVHRGSCDIHPEATLLGVSCSRLR